ncbi:hypothetical protein Tco_0724819 [Tanacetum coccineum]|uniref:Uncharacterized protein n=1 Tax=Tanacetum coccineum TaxID=301880 RepID=A0ABQ4YB86_9ASTR
MEHVVKALQKPVMLKVLLCLLLLFDHHRLALATSGGVMGGSDFSSFSDRHSSASDSSFSSKGDSAHNTYSSRRDSQYDSYSSRRDSPDTSYSSTRESSYSSNTPTPPIGSADIFLFICFLAIFLMCCYLYHRRGDHGEDTSFKTSVFKLQVYCPLDISDCRSAYQEAAPRKKEKVVGFYQKEDEVVPKVEDVSLVDGVFDDALGGDGEEYFIIEGRVEVS